MERKESASKTYDSVMAIGVDMQNDFCPGGALGVENGDQVVPVFNKVAEWTRAQGGEVIFTKDWHPAETKHFETWPPHCIQDASGAEFHPNLEIRPGDEIIAKGTDTEDDGYSGFEGATEDGRTLKEIVLNPEIYHENNRIALLIGGLATDYCVKETVLDACELKKSETSKDIGVFVIRDAVKAVGLQSDDEKNAIELMEQNGAEFIDSDELLAGKILEVQEA